MTKFNNSFPSYLILCASYRWILLVQGINESMIYYFNCIRTYFMPVITNVHYDVHIQISINRHIQIFSLTLRLFEIHIELLLSEGAWTILWLFLLQVYLNTSSYISVSEIFILHSRKKSYPLRNQRDYIIKMVIIVSFHHNSWLTVYW